MEQINLKINSQTLLDNEIDTIIYETKAKLIKSAKYQIISYIDKVNDDDKVIIKYNDDVLIIQRDGSIKNKLVFDKQKSSYGIYEVQGNNMKLNIDLLSLNTSLTSIDLEYKLLIQAQDAGHFKISIEITK